MADIYLAGKVDKDEGDIDSFAHELEQRGHRITFKWWNQPNPLVRPYLAEANRETSRAAAAVMERGVRESDVFILFHNDSILGAGIETGIAIGDQSKPREKIIVFPESESADGGRRESVFYARNGILVVRGLQPLRSTHWY